ncbi:MAG: DUF4037 domain-containing protein [Clostridiales bacterium]|nr:DUF4037 domain-containing protein [Clostridiales bacterium]
MTSAESDVRAKNRRFYEERVAPMINEKFGGYAARIAVGLSGEGSDCFGFDDEISRDHDFGTGVCLWLTDEDMALYGEELAGAYEKLVSEKDRSFYTERLRERRGVMTIHDFYSNILRIDCDTDGCTMTEQQWLNLDHACLATAVNGEVYRDDLGAFTKFRKLLLDYYPDRVWRIRIAEKMHDYSAALQVNYARCMTRGDVVAAELCKAKGLESAMELYFLLKRVFPPYYKWTFRELEKMDDQGGFAERIRELASTPCSLEAWEDTRYHPNRQNLKDRIVCASENIGYDLAEMLKLLGLTNNMHPYLESHVRRVLGNTDQ